MKVKDRAKPKIPPVSPGVYMGICVGVIDLGEQYSERFKSWSPKVQFVFELDGQTVEVDGEEKPRQLSKELTVSTSKKGALRSFLSAWNGIQYGDDAFADLELFDQIGRGAMLNVVLSETGAYANIDTIMPLPVGQPVPKIATTPIRWNMDAWDDQLFEALPEWVREKIRKSSQYRKEHPPTDVVDFPSDRTAVPSVPPVTPAAQPPIPSGTGRPVVGQGASRAAYGPGQASAAPGAAAPSPIDFAAYAQPRAAAQPQAVVPQGGDVPF